MSKNILNLLFVLFLILISFWVGRGCEAEQNDTYMSDTTIINETVREISDTVIHYDTLVKWKEKYVVKKDTVYIDNSGHKVYEGVLNYAHAQARYYIATTGELISKDIDVKCDIKTKTITEEVIKTKEITISKYPSSINGFVYASQDILAPGLEFNNQQKWSVGAGYDIVNKGIVVQASYNLYTIK